MRPFLYAIGTFFFCAAGAIGTSDVQPRYTVTDVGNFDLYTNMEDWHRIGIDGQGDVIGSRFIRIYTLAEQGPPNPYMVEIDQLMLFRAGKMHDLGLPPGAYTAEGEAISPDGKYIAGTDDLGSDWDPDPHMFLRHQNRFHEAKVIYPTHINAVNDKGWAVGTMTLPQRDYTAQEHAFLWRDDKLRDLGTLGSRQDLDSVGAAINNAGIIVGHAAKYDAKSGWGTHPFHWQQGVMEDVWPSDRFGSVATGINDLGEIVGWSRSAKSTPVKEGHCQAFLYSHTAFHMLPNLGQPESLALGINNHDQIVGWIGTRQDHRAALWLVQKCYDLNTLILAGLGWTLIEAKALNDRGQIVGVGVHNGKERDFLLTPVR